MMYRFFSTLLAALMLAGTAHAQEAPKVQARLIGDVANIEAGKSFHVGLELTIEKHWHVYWQNPGDSGMATSIRWELPEGISASDIAWPAPERLPYDTLVNYGYSDKVVLPVAITATKNLESTTLKAKAEWLVCKDICIPESAELELALPTRNAADGQAIAEALARVPTSSDVAARYIISADHVTLSIPNAQEDIANARDAIWFPLDDGIIQNSGEQITSQEEGALVIRMQHGTFNAAPEYKGVLVLLDAEGERNAAYTITARYDASLSGVTPTAKPAPETSTSSMGFVNAMLFALLGGLILNLMPCVLPVLSLKALALAKKAEASRREALLQGVAYTAGVVLSFLAIAGIMIALTHAGSAIGWGFQLQTPEVLAALAALMLVVALNLFGMFEWPVLFANVGGNHTHDSLTGSFLTGALAVALATPCTAPFMAPALGFAATQPPVLALAVFAALGFGLALPFLLISAVPAARRLLPKPGAWMLTFKQLLAFPILATAIWLLWVQVQLNQAHGLAVTLFGMLVISFFLWLYRGASRLRNLWVLATLAAFAALIMLQPPVSIQPHTTTMRGDITSVAYSAEKLAALRAENTPVFVDATAAWCITCKVNERVALNDASVVALFKEKSITLMVADWTMRDSAITQYLASFGRNGVPLYVYYAPGKEGVLLPQILTPEIVRDALTDH